MDDHEQRFKCNECGHVFEEDKADVKKEDYSSINSLTCPSCGSFELDHGYLCDQCETWIENQKGWYCDICLCDQCYNECLAIVVNKFNEFLEPFDETDKALLKEYLSEVYD